MLYYKQACSSFDINQLHRPILFSIAAPCFCSQYTPFLSLLPGAIPGQSLHNPTLKTKEKTQQKQPHQTLNSTDVVWQHIWSICLQRKYSCHHPETMLLSAEPGLWMACPGTLQWSSSALIPGGFGILLLLVCSSPSFFSFPEFLSSCSVIYLV